jgi:hypothetical protein
LSARARERGAVLVVLGAPAQGSDVRLRVTNVIWAGMGCGHGHLHARQVEVEVSGRRAAARVQRSVLWLPGPTGHIERSPARSDTEPGGAPGAALARDGVIPFPGRGVTAMGVRGEPSAVHSVGQQR